MILEILDGKKKNTILIGLQSKETVHNSRLAQ
jgi:hypothetical protein